MISIRFFIAAYNRPQISLKYTHRIILQVVLRTGIVHVVKQRIRICVYAVYFYGNFTEQFLVLADIHQKWCAFGSGVLPLNY